MSELKTVSPLLDDFSLGQSFSSHYGVTCRPALHTATKEKFILKQISIPASQIQVDALLLTGSCADRDAAQAYYSGVAEELQAEISILKKLSKSRGFAPFYGQQLVPKEEGQVGFDLYILSPYKTSLAAYTKRNAMTHLSAVNLGIDLCAALSSCRKVGYLYQDLRPENIFLTSQKQFQISDLGFFPLDELTYATFPDRYRSCYAAPELSDDFAGLNPTIDIYALGMVLYQVYNGGRLPFVDESAPEAAEARRCGGEALPAPIYADYEMAAIILKATAFHPEDRWLSPEEMGQALVAYMQRNEVNDSIIAPPILSEPLLDAASAEIQARAEHAASPMPEPKTKTEDPDAVSDSSIPESASQPAPTDQTPLASSNSASAEDPLAPSADNDETLPSEADADGTVQDDETAEILARAEALLQGPAEPEAALPAPEPDPVEEETTPEMPELSKAAQTEPAPKAASPQEFHPKKSHTGWIVLLAVVLVLAALAAGGYYYYANYYCVNIDQLSVVSGNTDTLTVELTTSGDPSLLTLVCQDTYGNAYRSGLTDGKATFSGLSPNTQYTIFVEIEGFHRVTGRTTAAYTTGAQTEIVSFTAIVGQEDGSVILSFTANGTEPSTWTLRYTAPEEAEQTRSFSGHSVTVTGLTEGKTYTFQLDAGDEIDLTGSDTLEYTVSPVVTANNLAVTAYGGSALTVSWDEPETPVAGWSVRCYNNDGFDQTLQVEACSASFEGIDPTSAYTIDVTAEGMTQKSWIAVTANPITITNTSVQTDTPGAVTVSWEFSGDAPEGGWILLYSFGAGPEATEAIPTSEPTATLQPAIPGSAYTFQIQASNGATVFQGSFQGATPEAEAFDAYGVTASNVFMATFPTPDDPDWATKDIDPDIQTTQFTPTSKIAFVLEATEDFKTDDAEILTTVVVRDSAGVPVDYYFGTAQWHTMWTHNQYLGQLERTPQTPGEYQLEIYFNSQLVKALSFTISE